MTGENLFPVYLHDSGDVSWNYPRLLTGPLKRMPNPVSGCEGLNRIFFGVSAQFRKCDSNSILEFLASRETTFGARTVFLCVAHDEVPKRGLTFRVYFTDSIIYLSR